MPSGQLSSFNGILIKYKVAIKKPTTYAKDFWINNTKQRKLNLEN